MIVGSCKKLWPVEEGTNHHTNMDEVKFFADNPFVFCVVNNKFQVRGDKARLNRAEVDANDLSLRMFVRCSKIMLDEVELRTG